ncbi:MAG TPA: YdcF family protein [Bacteroidales bacterium]|nr:YdcF family protein [Bacteroidales bacterium]HPT03079.1 YdcF family protein [Bacteroidales bacterium]
MLKWLRITLISLGAIFLVSLIFAFTTAPFYAMYKLAVARGKPAKEPVAVILLGGAGMPSENGLMRCYYAAGCAARFPESKVVVAIPGDLSDSADSPVLFAKELMIRGVPDERISFENKGRNTRQQALNLSKRWQGKGLSKPIILVTGPEHMYRAIACFEKAGFTYVSGAPTFESSIDENQMQFEDKELKGNRNIPAIGHRPQVRYQFWNHLKYEVNVGREAFAIAYYKLKGWI